ncbi:MAG: hypothetical protein QOK27_2802 [Gemmatimonadales bacterium]|nr:hypothetical protein [Gemmatimonadales bacterium]
MRPWRAAHEVEFGQAGERVYMLQRCVACGSASLADASAPGAPGMYETGLYGTRDGWRERALEPLRGLVDRDRLRLLGPLAPGRRVIEIGTGRGRLVAALRSRGHDAVGVEPSKASSGEAQSRGLPVSPVSLAEASFPDGEADLVVMWHVLEHLDRPAEALDRAKGWLRPGGEVVIAVPNLASVQARIGGDRWFHQDVPRHRTQFTRNGLEALVRRCGFAPTQVRQTMLDQAQLGMWLTLLNRVTHGRDVPLRYLKRDLRYTRRADAARDAVATLAIGIPLMPVAAVLELGSGLAGRGGAVVLRARLA